MNYEDVFRRKCLRRVVQDVLVDGVGYDEPGWGTRGYRFGRRIDVEEEWHGVVVLTKWG